jgi:DNA-binding CsgD family transcriptional regulator
MKRTIPKEILDNLESLKSIKEKELNYISARESFIELCISSRITYDEIANMLNITKQRVYMIHKRRQDKIKQIKQ